MLKPAQSTTGQCFALNSIHTLPPGRVCMADSVCCSHYTMDADSAYNRISLCSLPSSNVVFSQPAPHCNVFTQHASGVMQNYVSAASPVRLSSPCVAHTCLPGPALPNSKAHVIPQLCTRHTSPHISVNSSALVTACPYSSPLSCVSFSVGRTGSTDTVNCVGKSSESVVCSDAVCHPGRRKEMLIGRESMNYFSEMFQESQLTSPLESLQKLVSLSNAPMMDLKSVAIGECLRLGNDVTSGETDVLVAQTNSCSANSSTHDKICFTYCGTNAASVKCLSGNILHGVQETSKSFENSNDSTPTGIQGTPVQMDKRLRGDHHTLQFTDTESLSELAHTPTSLPSPDCFHNSSMSLDNLDMHAHEYVSDGLHGELHCSNKPVVAEFSSMACRERMASLTVNSDICLHENEHKVKSVVNDDEHASPREPTQNGRSHDAGVTGVCMANTRKVGVTNRRLASCPRKRTSFNRPIRRRKKKCLQDRPAAVRKNIGASSREDVCQQSTAIGSYDMHNNHWANVSKVDTDVSSPCSNEVVVSACESTDPWSTDVRSRDQLVSSTVTFDGVKGSHTTDSDSDHSSTPIDYGYDSPRLEMPSDDNDWPSVSGEHNAVRSVGEAACDGDVGLAITGQYHTCHDYTDPDICSSQVVTHSNSGSASHMASGLCEATSYVHQGISAGNSNMAKLVNTSAKGLPPVSISGRKVVSMASTSLSKQSGVERSNLGASDFVHNSAFALPSLTPPVDYNDINKMEREINEAKLLTGVKCDEVSSRLMRKCLTGASSSGRTRESIQTFAPFVRVRRQSENATLVRIHNFPQSLDASKHVCETGLGIPRSSNRQEVSATFPPVEAVLSPSNATSDSPWVCALCSRRSGYGCLGDLFGPYSVESRGRCSACCAYDTFLHGLAGSSGVRRSVLCRCQDSCAEDWRLVSSEVWVHEDCALWSSGVYVIGTRLFGMKEAVEAASGSVSDG